MPEKRMKMEYRKLSSLKVNIRNDQIFRNLGPEEIQELADSIKTNGLINPITIRPDGRIIAGHQRYRAACYAFRKEKETKVPDVDIPVVIRDLSERECRRIWISENIHRRNLSTRETILGNYMLVLDKLAEMRGQSDDSNLQLSDNQLLEKLSEGELSRAIAALIAGGEIRHKEKTVRQHILIAQGLIKDLQDLVFSDQLTQVVGAALAALPGEDQQRIADQIKNGKLAIDQVDELQKDLKKVNRHADELERDYKSLEKQLEKLGNDEEGLGNIKLAQAKKKHEEELKQLAEEKKKFLEQIDRLEKQAELIATKAKYDKLINSVLLLDGIASRGTPDEAMSSRLQFGVLDDGFVLMMENVSQFLADCVKATKKQAFQDRAKSKILSINR